jgi:hypothetical protein
MNANYTTYVSRVKAEEQEQLVAVFQQANPIF